MKVKIREIGNVRVVDLEGELKLGAGDTALRETVRGLVSQGHSRIVLNLRGVKWIDSSGVGELVACRKRTVERGGDTKLLMPSEGVYNLLVLVRLHEYFNIFHEEPLALLSF